MPHMRARYAVELIKKLSRFSPIVGVLGHRQVGKTTCLEQICSAYFTFDLPGEMDAANIDPEGYVERRKTLLTGIDECQMVPALFKVLKERVRVDKRPGQFILSGSVRFTAKKEIHESLTGRIMDIELLPFVISELNNEKLPDHLPMLLRQSTEVVARKLSSVSKKKSIEVMRRYLNQGGLPGICFIREESLKKEKSDSQLRTILGRDFQSLQKTTLTYLKVRQLLQILSTKQGEPLSIAEIARQARISKPTLIKTIETLQNLFLIRIYPTHGGERRPVIFFEDQGEASVLSGILGTKSEDEMTPRDVLRFFYANARAQFLYRKDKITEIFQYRTRGGALVPLVFAQGHRALGIIPILSETPETTDIKSGASFLKKYPDSKLIFMHAGEKIQVLDSRQLVAPAVSLVS